MGIIFATMFFLIPRPLKWIHHCLFAAVGGAMAALTTVLVSPAVLRSARNRMAFLALVFFVLAFCFASTNGWWYALELRCAVQQSGAQVRGRHRQYRFFSALGDRGAVWAFWLHLSRRGESRVVDRLTAALRPDCGRVHGRGVRRVDGQTAWCASTRPTPTGGPTSALPVGGCGLADDVLVEPDSNAGFPQALLAITGRSVRWAARSRRASPPTEFPTASSPRPSGFNNPQPGTDYD